MNAVTPEAVLFVLRTRDLGGVSISELARMVTGAAPTRGHERLVRSAIVALRRNGYPICSHPSTGYFMATCGEDLDRTCRFLIDRAMTSLAQVAAMRRITLPDLYGQMNLNLKEG